MAILAECPICHRKQSVKNKKCNCGQNLDLVKKSRKVRYWINYRMQDGKQRRESVGAFKDLDPYSIEDAEDAMSKRRVQKRERKLFDELPESTMTFAELTKWYLDLEKIKALASHDIIKIKLGIFNAEFGSMVVSQIKPANLESYQVKRLKEGVKPSTVDQEIGKAKAMVYKAFDNDLVGGDTIKTFKRIKKMLKPGSDVRERILSGDEFESLLENTSGHIKGIIMTGYYTGMRKGEILNLTWDRVDLHNRMIRLEAEDTKDREKRNIPICDELYNLLVSMPNRLHESGQANHVFQFKGQPIKDIRTGLKRACKKAKIKYGRFVKGGFIFHDLRHTFNTNMRKAGVAESVIMRVTGHSTREMFDRYNTVDESDTRQAVAQMVDFIENVDHPVDQGTKKAPTEVNQNSVRA
jgi:integrase